MQIDRIILGKINQILAGERKVVIIYGPRQAGKSTIINEIISKTNRSHIVFLGDDVYAQKILSNNEIESLKRIVGNNDLIVIDEAQRIENIGLTLKLLIDNFSARILVSGSASFDLANKISEPLTGRNKIFWLYPLAVSELAEKYRSVSPSLSLEEMLRFGMFPKIHTLTTENEKIDYLFEYVNSYLSKDILMFENIRKPKKVLDLLSLLALQIGKEVSIAELAQNLVMNQKTVQSYLDVLEKMFVIVNLRGFSRNLRKEIAKTSKYYFLDVGLRNALIRNFNKLDTRPDVGDLFENWFVVEKMKASQNTGKIANFYFWRTYDQQGIDLIEERDGKLMGYECKWNGDKKAKVPEIWLETYDNASFEVVNNENYLKFLV